MNARKKILSLLLGVLSATSCSLRQNSSSTGSSTTPPSNTSSSTTPTQGDNTYGEGITEEEKGFLGQIAEGDITKAEVTGTGFDGKFEVRQADVLTAVVYRGTLEVEVPRGPVTFTIYVTISATDYTILDYVTDGTLTTHGQDGAFADDALGLIGSTGEGTAIAGSTLTADAIIDFCQKASAQAKADLEGGVIPPDPEPELSISLSSSTLLLETTREQNDMATLTATVEGATEETGDIVWKSSDESIAYIQGNVDSNTVTVVSRMRPGTCTITATIGDKSASCEVTVVTASVELGDVGLEEATIAELNEKSVDSYGTKYFRVSGIATNILSGGGMTLVDRDDPTQSINVNGLAKDGNDLDSLFTWQEGRLDFTNPVNFDDQFDAGEGDEIQIVAILTETGLEGYLEKVLSSEETLSYPLTANVGEHGSLARVDVQMVDVPQEDGSTVTMYHVVENSSRALPSTIGFGEMVYFVVTPEEGYEIESVTTTINGIKATHYDALGNDQDLALYSIAGDVGAHSIDVAFAWANPDYPEPTVQETTIDALLSSETDMDGNYYTVEGIIESFDEQNPKLGGMTLLDPTTRKALSIDGLSASFSKEDFAFDHETGHLSYTNPETFATLFPEGEEPTIERGDLISVTGIYVGGEFRGGFNSVVTPNEDISYSVTTATATNGTIRLVDAHYDEALGEYVIDGNRAETSAICGETVFVEIKANEGFEIETILLNGQEITLSPHNEEGTLYSFTMGLSATTVSAEFKEAEEVIDPSEDIVDITLSDLLSQTNDRTKLYRVTGVLRGTADGFGGTTFTLYDKEDPSLSMDFSYLSKAATDDSGANVFVHDGMGWRIESSNDNFVDIYGTEIQDGSVCTFVVAVDGSNDAYGYFEKKVSDPSADQKVSISVEINDYYGYGTITWYDESNNPIEQPTEATVGSSLHVSVSGFSYFCSITVNGTVLVDYAEAGTVYEIPVEGPTTILFEIM